MFYGNQLLLNRIELKCKVRKSGLLFQSIYLKFFFSPQEKRGCSAATVANHISSILYPIKFLHREDAPDFDNVAIIKQLRVQATLLQREGDLERPSSKEDFESQNRWLPW